MTFPAKLPKLDIKEMRSLHKIQFPSFAPRRIFKSRFLKLNLFVLTYLLLFISLVSLYIISLPKAIAKKETLGQSTRKVDPNTTYMEISPTNIPEPTIELTQTPNAPVSSPIPTTNPITQTTGTTKTIENVSTDHSMATANEVFNALNSYRNEKGIGSLSWDDTLANFAQGRVNVFSSSNTLDDHAGFRDFMNNNGFEVSGFNGLGENSAQLSGPMGGDKIIREIYGGSSAHNSSQLDPSWTHAGVAINGIYININFGKDKR